MIRYDYRCGSCGRISEVLLSIKSDPGLKLDCPACGASASSVRQMGFGNVTHQGINAASKMASKYPVVSNQLPFALPDCPHAGPLKKSVITSREHERKVYDRLQMVRGYVDGDTLLGLTCIVFFVSCVGLVVYHLIRTGSQ